MACPWSCACDPPLLPLSKLPAIQDHTWWNNFELREGHYYISQTSDWQRFEVKKGRFFIGVSQHFCNCLWLHQIKKWSKCCVHYSEIPAMLTLTKKRVNRSFLTKPFWSRWPAIGFILFCSWTLTSLSPYNQAKKKRLQESNHLQLTHIHTYKWMRFWFRVVKSIRLPVKITTYLTGYSAWHFFTDDVFSIKYPWTGRLLWSVQRKSCPTAQGYLRFCDWASEFCA